jgi:RNase H-fold protein (predicted Holliday junction resolvase)
MQLILGISLSRRSVGMALLSYGSLIRWNVQTFQRVDGKDRNRAVIHAIQQFVTKYPVSVVAIKVPDRLERYAQLVKLMGGINVALERQKVTCCFYTLNEVKQFYSEDIRINKQALMQFVLEKYSVLHSAYRTGRDKNKQYYMKIFEAVAVAHVCKKEMERNSK